MANQHKRSFSTQLDSDDVIEIGADGELKSGKICSECGTVSKFKANYCLNCGASFADPSVRASIANERSIDDDGPTLRKNSDPLIQPIFGYPFYDPFRRNGGAFEIVMEFIVAPLITFIFTAIYEAIVKFAKLIGIVPSLIIGICLSLFVLVSFTSHTSGYTQPANSHSQPTSVAIQVNTASLSSDTTSAKLIVAETLPSEADVACLAQLPKNEQRIAFNYTTNGYQGIEILSLDGSHFCRLTAPTGLEVTGSDKIPLDDAEPGWLPDGRIAFKAAGISAFSKQTFGVYIAGMDGSRLQHLQMSPQIPFFQGISSPAAWSPDGKHIALAGQSPNYSDFSPFEIYILNTDGSGLRQLTTNAYAQYPAWSPDSNWIFFASADVTAGIGNGVQRLYKIAADGSKLIPIVNSPNNVDSFALSADGKYIAVITSLGVPDERYRLSVMNSDGTNPQILITGNPFRMKGSLDIMPPMWLPDNQTIVFYEDENDIAKTFEIKRDGTGLKRFYTGAEEITDLTISYPTSTNTDEEF